MKDQSTRSKIGRKGEATDKSAAKQCNVVMALSPYLPNLDIATKSTKILADISTHINSVHIINMRSQLKGGRRLWKQAQIYINISQTSVA